MNSQQETATIRAREVVGEQIGYLSAALGVTRGRLVEIAMDQFIEVHGADLRKIEKAILDGDSIALDGLRSHLATRLEEGDRAQE